MAHNLRENVGNPRGRLEDMVSLLPTPAASLVNDGEDVDQWDARRARVKATGVNGNGMGEPLTIAAQRLALLPTPSVADGTGGHARRGGSRGDELLLAGTAVEHETDWGHFAPAIDRWERVVGRPAPSPTEPTGRGGKHRLSPAFVEWMMGLPEGWVTDVPITRNEQLKALGNGVVPAQSVAALKDMKESFDHERKQDLPVVRRELREAS